MSTENPKIPCGGFRIGDGLAMDGDTLKSLGGAFVLTEPSTDPSKPPSLVISEDSPLKTFEEVEATAPTKPLFLTIKGQSGIFIFNPTGDQDALYFDQIIIDTTNKKLVLDRVVMSKTTISIPITITVTLTQ